MVEITDDWSFCQLADNLEELNLGDDLREIIKKKDSDIKQKDSVIKRKDSVIQQRNSVIQQRNSVIQQRDSDIERLKKLLAENLFYKDDIIHIGNNVSKLPDVKEFIQEYGKNKNPKELIKDEDIISLINCNAGLRKNMSELSSFIEELNFPTFIVATEIKRSRIKLLKSEIQLKKYFGPFIGCKDEIGEEFIDPSKYPHGGVAIWVKKMKDKDGIDFKKEDIHELEFDFSGCKPKKEEFDYKAIKVQFNKVWIIIVGIYRKVDGSKPIFVKQHFETLIKNFSNFKSKARTGEIKCQKCELAKQTIKMSDNNVKVILTGDLNINFMNDEEDYIKVYKGRIEHHGFKQNIEGVTRRLGNGGTCIDHIITNFHPLQKGILHKNISDHQVTMAIWNTKNEKDKDYLVPPISLSSHNARKKNWVITSATFATLECNF